MPLAYVFDVFSLAMTLFLMRTAEKESNISTFKI